MSIPLGGVSSVTSLATREYTAGYLNIPFIF